VTTKRLASAVTATPLGLLTQETMAELLGVSQAEVSKMERRTELYVGTLRKFIEAMNGELVIAARFADGVEVPIRLVDEEDAALS
jgi:hypothetical protein